MIVKTRAFAAFCILSWLILGGSALGAAEPQDSLTLPHALLLLGYPAAHQLELATQQGTLKVKPPSPPKAGHEIFPSLSLDGRYLATAYMRSPYPNYREGIAIYSIREKTWRCIEDLHTVWAISFSPNGSKLAVIADADSSSPTSLLLIDLKSERVEIHVDNFSDHGPMTWSPDGQSLAYTHVRPGPDPHVDTHETEINILELATKRTKKLASDCAWPSWSPSGEWIAFVNQDGGGSLIHPDGTGVRLVAKLGRKAPWFNRRELEFPPVWAPDSTQLLLNEGINDETGRFIINLLDVASGKLERKTGKGVAVLGWASER